ALDSLVDALSRYLYPLPTTDVESLLPTHIAALARVFPVLRRVRAVAAAVQDADSVLELAVDVHTLRQRASGALRELLARIAVGHRLVLFIDDLHWGDADSADLIADLLRPPNAPNLLLIGCYRRGEATAAGGGPISERASTFLGTLQRIVLDGLTTSGVDVRTLHTDQLDAASAREMAVRLLDDLQPPARAGEIDAVVAEAEGCPFFIAELARFLTHSTRDGHRSDLSTLRADGFSIGDVLLERVRTLPDDCRHALALIAVAGRPLRVSALRRAAADGLDVRDALNRLRVAHLTRRIDSDGAEEVDTYHERIRDAVVQRHLNADVRRQHHRALAEALEVEAQIEPEILADHYQAIGAKSKALSYIALAAERAQRSLAFERAVRLYLRALDLVPVQSPRRYQYLFQLAEAQANVGHSSAAAEHYLEAAEVTSGSTRPLPVQRHAAEKLLISGHIARGLKILNHVLRHADWQLNDDRLQVELALRWTRWQLRRLRPERWTPPPMPTATTTGGGDAAADDAAIWDEQALERIDIAWTAALGLSMVEPHQAALFHARALLGALRVGEPARVARSLALEVYYGHLAGDDPQPALRRALDLAGRFDNPYAGGLASLAAGMVTCGEGSWTRAAGHLEQAASHLTRAAFGVAWEQDTLAHLRQLVHAQLGRWTAAFDGLNELRSQARERGDRYLEALLVSWAGVLQQLAADSPEAARALLADAYDGWKSPHLDYPTYRRLFAEVSIDLYLGDGERA
ncbi:MAG: AAA family ATPase, partial [Acidobacteriota bacterium]